MSSRVRLPLLVALAAAAAAAPPAPAAVLSVAAEIKRGPQDGSSARPFGTISAALAAARPGDRIEVGPGLHRGFRDTRDHGATVTVTAADPRRPPVIGGAVLAGAAHLELAGLGFNASVQLTALPTDRSRGAHHITIRDSFLTSRVPFRSSCVIVRSGSRDVVLERNVMERCLYGVSGPGDGFVDRSLQPVTERVAIRGNVLQNLAADGLQFGNWHDVDVRDNLIRHIHDPARREHNDGIQIMGNSRDVRIADNVIGDSTQLVFTQNPLGRNYDISITGNLLLDGDGYSVQLSGTTNVVFARNTVWHSKIGVIFREGTFGTWRDNVIDRYTPGTSSRAVVNEGGNLIRLRTAGTPHPGDLMGIDPQFADAVAGDFSLLANSPGFGAGAGPAATRGAQILLDPPLSAASRALARAARRAGSRRPSAAARRSTRRIPSRGARATPAAPRRR